MAIWDFLREQFNSNQFLQGGALLGILGSILFFLRSIPGRIYNLVKSRILFTAWFDSRDPIFGMFHSWVNRQAFVREKRSVRIITNHRKDPPEIITTFGYGTYLVRHQGIWMLISQVKDEKQGIDKGMSALLLETYSVTCMFWRRSIIMDLLRDVVDSFSIEETGEVPMYQWRWGHWYTDAVQPKKSMDKLVLRKGLLEEIDSDVQQFLNSADWYDAMQIPYQRGYLLTGPAGTGKTTLASCLASKHNLRLCILDITEISDDGELRRALTSTPGRSIVLIEDFDSFFEGRKNKRASSKVTFSGLLNAINGVVNNQGRILLLTTNQEKTVDPALARMGRIDKRFHLDYANANQAERLFSMFHPNTNGSAEQFGTLVEGRDLSPADLTGHFQAYRAGQCGLMDINDLVKDRDDRRDLSRTIRREAEEELVEKANNEEKPSALT